MLLRTRKMPSGMGIPARFIFGGRGDRWRQRGLSSSPNLSMILATSKAAGSNTERTRRKPPIERKRLFEIIEDLVLWKNTTNEEVLERARAEIRRSWREVCDLNKDHPQAVELFNPDKLPALHDPFAGGGSIPLEAQRLGLEAYASDLNPVAVLINKAMIEIPPKFAGQPPVSSHNKRKMHKERTSVLSKHGLGATGLAEDVRYYGAWMRDEAEKRIGHLYPQDRDHGRIGEGTAGSQTARGPETHRHRLDLGAHGQKPQSCLLPCGRAA